MILKKHLHLNSKNMRQAMYLAVLGVATLPFGSFANNVNQKELSGINYGGMSMSSPKLSGHAAFNYSYDDTGVYKNLSHKTYGDWRFNQFQLNLDGTISDMPYKVEYLWYGANNFGQDLGTYHQLLETYIGCHMRNSTTTWQLGNTMVPFGLMDNLSWWKNMAFYTGLGDDYKVGIRFIHHSGPWDYQLQLAKGSWLSDNQTSSVTPKLTTGLSDGTATTNINQNNRDSVQVTGRVTRVHEMSGHKRIEGGLSLRLGSTYNIETTRRGGQLAGAVHVKACMNDWKFQAQYIPYSYSPNHGNGASSDGKTMQFAKDGVRYTIPSKANVFSVGLAYTMHVSWGKIHEVTVYDDYSQLSGKRTETSSKMNVVGAKMETGPLFAALDVISAKNMFGVGHNGTRHSVNTYNIGSNNDTATGTASAKWKMKVNLNFGAKF
jgi:hypothetical protein